MVHLSGRRRFIQSLMRLLAYGGALAGPLGAVVRRLEARGLRVPLAPQTDPATLVNRNPAELDSSQLPITPLERFGTMGATDHATDLSSWRFEVQGAVASPQRLRFEELSALPAMEREVLMICPGVFAQHGRWRGVSLQRLLERAGADPQATHVTLSGPRGPYANLQRFPLAEARSGQVFLAWGVNGQPLPRRHGFPLRVVAADYHGFSWVKYVDRMVVERVP